MIYVWLGVLTFFVVCMIVDNLRRYSSLSGRVRDRYYAYKDLDGRVTELYNELTEKFSTLQNSCIDNLKELREDEVRELFEDSSRFGGAIEVINLEIERMKTRVDGVHAAMESLKTDRLNAFNNKLNRANEEVDWIKKRLDRNEEPSVRLASQAKSIEQLEQQVSTLNGWIAEAKNTKDKAESAYSLASESMRKSQKASELVKEVHGGASTFADTNLQILRKLEAKVAELNAYILEHAKKERLHQAGESLPPRQPLGFEAEEPKTVDEIRRQYVRPAGAFYGHPGRGPLQTDEDVRAFMARLEQDVEPRIPRGGFTPRTGPSTIDRATFETFVTPHHTPEDDVCYLDPNKDPFNDGR